MRIRPIRIATSVARPGLFGGDVDRCFQLSNHGAGRRRYDTVLADVPVRPPSGPADDGGCMVRRSLSQPMRNLALAHLLLAESDADRAVYAVCAPESHKVIWRRFREVQAAFPDTYRRTIRAVTAEQIASLHADGGAAFDAHYHGAQAESEEARAERRLADTRLVARQVPPRVPVTAACSEPKRLTAAARDLMTTPTE